MTSTPLVRTQLRRQRIARIAALLFGLAALAPAAGASGPWSRPERESPDGPEQVRVHLTRSEALEAVFGASVDSIASEVWTPSATERATIERRLGWRLEVASFEIFHGFTGGEAAGVAVVTEEVGLYRPITFIVKVDPSGEVGAVRVMVYRESRGGEVRRLRFLRQYRGKDVTSPIRINRDIIAVTGATLSTRAINAGVKRVLTVLDVRRGSASTSGVGEAGLSGRGEG